MVSREAPGSPTGSQGGCGWWGSSMFHPTPTSVHNLPGASGRQAAQRVSPQLRPSQLHLLPVRSLQQEHPPRSTTSQAPVGARLYTAYARSCGQTAEMERPEAEQASTGRPGWSRAAMASRGLEARLQDARAHAGSVVCDSPFCCKTHRCGLQGCCIPAQAPCSAA